MGKPNLSRRNVATEINQLNPPKIRVLPGDQYDENGLRTQKAKSSPLPRYENADQPRPHTIEGVVRPRKQ